MKAALITMSVIVIILILLFLPVHLYLCCDELFRVKLRWLFLTFKLSGYDESRKKQPEKKSGLKKPRQATPVRQIPFDQKLDGFLDDLRLYADLISGPGVRLLGYSRLARLKLDITAGSDDAAQTALLYGRLYASVGSFWAFLHNVIRVNDAGCRIRITPDFACGHSSFSLYSRLDISVYSLLRVLFNALRIYTRSPKGISGRSPDRSRKTSIAHQAS